MCKCVQPPGVNPIAVDKYIDIKNQVLADLTRHFNEIMLILDISPFL
jgi:hypothetical protein